MPPAPLPDEVFVGAGDIGVCGSAAPEATARLLDTIGGTVFTTGDHAYDDGRSSDFKDCYDPSWGRHKSRTFPSPGNHDYRTPGASGYFSYFGDRAGSAGAGYYSYDLGNWHVVTLNSMVAHGVGSRQLAWLQNDLDSRRRPCTLAYWHHPLFSSGQHGPNRDMRDVWRVLYAFDVDVVLNGHDHLYERFRPQTPEGRADEARGIRQFTVGTGGAKIYRVGARHVNSEIIQRAFGVLKLTLRADDYDWQFIATPGSGGSGDFGTDRCH